MCHQKLSINVMFVLNFWEFFCKVTEDFFGGRLEQMIDLKHPLAVLAKRMPWEQIEAALAPAFMHKSLSI